MRQGKIYIGTSGWHYKHWAGRFYPRGIKETDQLSYYVKFFKTVELNNSFYHLPLPGTFKNWKNATPKNFVFAVKGSRFISHLKKLNVDRKSIGKFFKNVSKLDEKLGPVLFQLPPKWKLNLGRFETFLSRLPVKHSYSFEFRDHSWYNKEVNDLLTKHNAAFCIYELAGHLSPITVTADFVYIRLHGPGAKYSGSYSDSALKKWMTRIMTWKEEGIDVYIYFDNDQLGYAAFNALRLQELISKKLGGTKTRILLPH
jgi:uncharacterized protein YecE (DUF72 family)